LFHYQGLELIFLLLPKVLNARVAEKQKGNDSESTNGGKLIEIADRLQDIDAQVLY
jgi:hypothetical protein